MTFYKSQGRALRQRRGCQRSVGKRDCAAPLQPLAGCVSARRDGCTEACFDQRAFEYIGVFRACVCTSEFARYLGPRACGCRAVSVPTSASLFFSLVKARLVCRCAVVVGSYCANVTAVLSLRHLCLLHAVHFGTSGTLYDLFLTMMTAIYSLLLSSSFFFFNAHKRKDRTNCVKILPSSCRMTDEADFTTRYTR